jgi:hypothetical protein
LSLGNSRGSRNLRRSAALFFLSLIVIASGLSCRDGGKQSATPSPSAIGTAVASPTPSAHSDCSRYGLPPFLTCSTRPPAEQPPDHAA